MECNKVKGKCSILILLDLSAACDTVDHQKLLCDLKDLGITGFALSWFKTYLTDRNFKTILNAEESELVSMKYGVRQGTSYIVHYLYANSAIYVELL